MMRQAGPGRYADRIRGLIAILESAGGNASVDRRDAGFCPGRAELGTERVDEMVPGSDEQLAIDDRRRGEKLSGRRPAVPQLSARGSVEGELLLGLAIAVVDNSVRDRWGRHAGEALPNGLRPGERERAVSGSLEGDQPVQVRAAARVTRVADVEHVRNGIPGRMPLKRQSLASANWNLCR